ncbi:uncharacterized protein LOC122259385 [Penaeus japonicus]|uniref:uncharacterized protein LOC122259385 n=1 Tax=Penaeus japonicus TaxID=27405 RepID=UPI001C714DAC|nr:uncharacterized protein LOC122259385 [Penaeus japonicus]
MTLFAKMQLVTLKIVIVILLYVNPAEPAIGQTCTSDHNCSRSTEECVQGWCSCSENAFLQLDLSTLTPECKVFSSVACKTASCPKNSMCTKDGICACMDGYFKIGAECKKGRFQEILEPCFVEDGEVFACDLSKYSMCLSGKCVCFETLFFNKSSGECEPKSEFLRANNISEYRVMPGNYCRNDSDCIEGLECTGFECSCPSYCRYKEEQSSCDCGAVGFSYEPIILGCVLGLATIGFWTWMIKRTILKHKIAAKRAALEKRNVTDPVELNPLHS